MVHGILSHGIYPIILAPHFPGGAIRETRNTIPIFRFPYFFPTSCEQLAYGEGLAYNFRRNFLAFIGIIPFIIAELLGSLVIFFRLRFDVIHTHWLIPQGLIGSILRKTLKIPHVATIHGSDLTIIKSIRVLHPVCRFIVKNSDFITLNSTYMMHLLLQIVPGCEDKVRVIPMGVNPDVFQKSANIRGVSSTPDKIILSVGRLIDWKGTMYLIEAMPVILQKYPRSILYIIGDGPEKEKLKQRVKALGLEEKIQFLGVVGKESLCSYYHRADVFVLPSITIGSQTEGLGVVILEAMASGCPVIGTDAGGIPDIIMNGKNAFLVPERDSADLAEKILVLLSDPVLADRFRDAGYETVRNRFSWEKISLQFFRIYEQLHHKFPRQGVA